MMMGECRPMSARITERQCGINRERGLFSCGRCDGLMGMADIDIEEGLMGKVGTCKNCKKDKAIIARDLCRSCYDTLRHKGELQTVTAEPEQIPVVSTDKAIHPPVQPLPEKDAPRSLLSMITPPLAVKTEGFFLDFSNHPGLLVDLEAISDDVTGDILELCSMLVSGKLRMVA